MEDKEIEKVLSFFEECIHIANKLELKLDELQDFIKENGEEMNLELKGTKSYDFLKKMLSFYTWQINDILNMRTAGEKALELLKPFIKKGELKITVKEYLINKNKENISKKVKDNLKVIKIIFQNSLWDDNIRNKFFNSDFFEKYFYGDKNFFEFKKIDDYFELILSFSKEFSLDLFDKLFTEQEIELIYQFKNN